MNRMQQTTVCLVFLDSCGCGPTPRIHLRAEHPGWGSMAFQELPVKRDLAAGKPASFNSSSHPSLRALQPLRSHSATATIRAGAMPALAALQRVLACSSRQKIRSGQGRTRRNARQNV